MDDAVHMRSTQRLGNGQRWSREVGHGHLAIKRRGAVRAADDPFEHEEGRSVRVTLAVPVVWYRSVSCGLSTPTIEPAFAGSV